MGKFENIFIIDYITSNFKFKHFLLDLFIFIQFTPGSSA